jgi:5'-phosphate synthase pdxT subunit
MVGATRSDGLQVGVLALQGGFAAHAQMLRSRETSVREVRTPEDLAQLDGLILPGGESTTLIRLLRASGLWEALPRFAARGGALFGTCAGLILLAESVRGPTQPSLGLLPVTVERNAYGRQVASFIAPGGVTVPPDLVADWPPGERAPLPRSPAIGDAAAQLAAEFVFIRAPRVTATAAGVEVLAVHAGDPVLVRHGALLGATFHPELSRETIVMDLFRALARRSRRRIAGVAP